jgi:glycosyltransferase involved in cell wall biosynthesis
MPKTSSSRKQAVPARQIKVLYVCPFAHYPGHFSWAATRETSALKQAGIDVRLLTFCGVIDETEVKVPQITVLSRTGPGHFARQLFAALRKNAITRWLLMSFETFLTLATAIRLKKRLEIDVIHLRDGEPYLFLPHILCLPLTGYKWLISLTASNIYPPAQIRSFKLLVYTTAVKVLNNKMWKPLYKLSMKRNRFFFAVQNDVAKLDYSKYMGGAFDGRVECLPVGVSTTTEVISKQEARRYLGIPPEKPVLLAFGAYHSGKDLETIFRALKNLPEVYFVHAGSQAFGLGVNLEEVARDYIDANRMSIRNYYVPEREKPYYFFAADAVILSYTRQFLSTSSLLWEACRFGTPVIASDNGQLRELIMAFQPGLLFSAQDPDSLREAIIRFINLKPAEIRVMKNNCRRFAEQFSMDKWALKCLELYDGLFEEPKKR